MTFAIGLRFPTTPRLTLGGVSVGTGNLLNQSQGGMCICRGWESGRGSCSSPSAFDCRTVRQRRLTSSLRRARPERKLPTLSSAYAGAGSAPGPCSPGTGSRSPPLSTTPNRLVSVEVQAVGRQVHQPQPDAGGPEIFPHRLATVRRSVVPDHVQPPAVTLP